MDVRLPSELTLTDCQYHKKLLSNYRWFLEINYKFNPEANFTYLRKIYKLNYQKVL